MRLMRLRKALGRLCCRRVDCVVEEVHGFVSVALVAGCVGRREGWKGYGS